MKCRLKQIDNVGQINFWNHLVKQFVKLLVKCLTKYGESSFVQFLSDISWTSHQRSQNLMGLLRKLAYLFFCEVECM